METSSSQCLNCGSSLQGKFCHDCGQKVIEPKERTVVHFIYQFFGSAFFLENNFLKNLWNLLTKPGKIPLDFIEGRRRRWMPPFSLFLLINLFYFWYSPLSDLNLKLAEQLQQPQHKTFANLLVDQKLKEEGITREQYAETYNQKSTGYSNSLIILHIPIFAGFLALFYFRKKYFYVDHIIVAVYFLAFVLLLSLIQVGFLYLFAGNLAPNAKSTWSIISSTYLAAILVYLFLYLKRVYDQKFWQAGLAFIPVFIALLVTHLLYRTLLFLIIFWVT